MTPASRRRILFVLVAAHVVFGVVVARLLNDSWPTPTLVLFLAHFFSVAGLLGLWSALVPLSLLRRLAGVMVGVLYLWSLPFISMLPVSGDDAVMFFLLAAFSAVPVFLAATTFGRFEPRLRLVSTRPLTDSRTPVQITTSFLFCATAVFAALLTVYEFVGKQDSNVAFAIVLSFSLGWIGWVAASATLVPNRVVLPVLAAVIACAPVGTIPSHYLDLGGPEPWMALAACQAAITVATLLVVRRCGYRLVPTADASRDGSAVVPDSPNPLA